MAIDISKISGLLNPYSSISSTQTNNNVTTNFADILLQYTNNTAKTNTIGDDIAQATQLNINDTSNLKAQIEQALNSGSANTLTNLLNQYSTSNVSAFSTLLNTSTNNNTTDIFQSLLSSSGTGNTSTSLLDLLNSSSANSTTSSNSLYSLLTGSTNSLSANPISNYLSEDGGTDVNGLYNALMGSNTSTRSTSSSSTDGIFEALQSTFLNNQLNTLTGAQANLQANLDQYTKQNANNMTDAVKSKIAEMTNNVNSIQSYIEEKMSARMTAKNDLIAQLQARGNNAIAALQANSASSIE